MGDIISFRRGVPGVLLRVARKLLYRAFGKLIKF